MQQLASNPYYPALDGVRAFCVLLVMLDHLKSNGHSPGWINGHLGVDIFFLISGFLITSLLRREAAATGAIDLPAFYTRRAFRILPAYLAVLLLYLAVCQLPSQAEHWHQFQAGLPYFLTFLNEFAREPNNGSVFGQTWSLGVEEKFYLLWPIFFFLLARTTRQRTILFAVLFAITAAAPFLGQGYLARAYFGLLVGCALAVTLTSSFAPTLARAVQRIPTPIILIILLLGFYAEHLSKNFILLFSLAAALCLAHLSLQLSWLTSFFSLPLLRWLGRRSYSMYLLHVLALNAFETRVRIDSPLRAAAVLFVAYALTALAAELLYRTIEQPARTFGKRLLIRRLHTSPPEIA